MVDNSKINKIEDLLILKEGQLFERKNARADKREIGNIVIGFANADGGRLVIGMEDDGTLSGFKNFPDQENNIRRFLSSWILPPPSYSFNVIKFKHPNEIEDQILIISIEQGSDLYKNRKDEVYLRVGSDNILLDFERRTQLMHDKGLQNFEIKTVEDANIKDLDLDLLKKYSEQIGVTGPERTLIARGLAEAKKGKIGINYAGILLFGKDPQHWIDLARVRVLRYEGVKEKTGEQLNITKDKIINGSIIQQIETTKLLVNSILRDFTQLAKETGKFITMPEYPAFAWQEAIINAVTHREYSIKGADIQVKIFDDHLEVISPGNFPSTVRKENIRNTHFSRNPKIARTLADMGYVKELGEGVDRMYQEMEKAGLPEPVFKNLNGTISVALYNDIQNRRLRKETDLLNRIRHDELSNLSADERSVLLYTIDNEKITTRECARLIGKSEDTALKVLKKLKSYSPPFLVDVRKSPQDPQAYYKINPEILEQIKDKEKQTPDSHEASDTDQIKSQNKLF